MATISVAPKTAILSEDQLPPLTVFGSETFGYRVRYRIISEDGNRFSHYSPIQTVVANYSFARPAGKGLSDFVIIRQGPYVNVVWDAVTITNDDFNNIIKKASQYDLWISWSKGEQNKLWIPADRVEGTLQGFIIPSSYELANGNVIAEAPTELSVEIYIRATSQSRDNTPLLIYSVEDYDISLPESPPSN